MAEKEKKNIKNGHKQTPDQKKRDVSWVWPLLCVILLVIVIAPYIQDTVNQSENQAKFVSNVAGFICGGSLFGTILSTIISSLLQYKNGKGIGNSVKHLLVFGVSIMLVWGCTFAYAEKKIANYQDKRDVKENQEVNEGKVVEEELFERKELQEFFWDEDLLIDDISNYLGPNSSRRNIPELLRVHLARPVSIRDTDYEKFERNVQIANALWKDVESCETKQMKVYGIQQIIVCRTQASDGYEDIDNLKLLGDGYVKLGDLVSENRVDNYKNALCKYIKALNLYYYSENEITTKVGVAEIWEEMSITYHKLASSLGEGRDIENARDMAKICEQWDMVYDY